MLVIRGPEAKRVMRCWRAGAPQTRPWDEDMVGVPTKVRA
jgi:hypothetical protein